MWQLDWSKLAEVLTYNAKQPMIFSSGLFLFLFLGFSLIYMLLQKKDTARILFVTLFSYYFYYKSSGFYFFLLGVVTVTDFLLAGRMANTETQWKRRVLLLASLGINLGLLCYFKYTNFFYQILAPLWNGKFQPLDIFLPVGISFFTFQSLSYTIDVYRRELVPLNRLLDYTFYVSFFPQLVAGPIVRARDFIPQIRQPLFVSSEMFGTGVFFIISGLFKKAVISDYISVNFVERIFDNPALYSGVENLFGVYGYALQIYCDFSGYSDMAIGFALLLGFRFPMNFNSPYKADSITDFWHRWHISLSTWLRDYLYISLGGNRKGKVRTYINLCLTMLLGGLWHGASWNFVIWGGFHGIALAAQKFWRNVVGRCRLSGTWHRQYRRYMGCQRIRCQARREIHCHHIGRSQRAAGRKRTWKTESFPCCKGCQRTPRRQSGYSSPNRPTPAAEHRQVPCPRRLEEEKSHLEPALPRPSRK